MPRTTATFPWPANKPAARPDLFAVVPGVHAGVFCLGLSMLTEFPVVDGVEFRHIPGATGYVAGSDGSIWSCRPEGANRPPRWREKKQYLPKKKRPYYEVGLRLDDGRQVAKRVHRLVLSAFTGGDRPGLDAAHNDGDRLNNVISNLRWATRGENFADRRRHGTWPINEYSGVAKLTRENVIEIKSRIAAGEGHVTIARDFGVTNRAISAIRCGKTWKHVQTEGIRTEPQSYRGREEEVGVE